MSDAKTKATARRALKDVDRELRRHMETAVDVMTAKGLIDEGHLPAVWALEIQTRDGVQVRFESGPAPIITTGKPAATIHSPAPASAQIKKVTAGQKSRIRKDRDRLGILEAAGHSLTDTAIAELDELPGSLPRDTATQIITALEAMSRS